MLYRERNAIEQMFSRLEDFRCIRYDRFVTNFLGVTYLAATVSY